MLKRLRILLLPFSLLYGLAVYLRNKAYDLGIFKTHRVDIPVISIGNLSAGGTGKTPMVEHLVRHLRAAGRHPGVLSRGYGRSTSGYLRVNPKAHSAREVGDEPLQIAAKFPDLPVAVCADRVAGARALAAEAAIDCLLLDDAFQHRRLHRDVNVVMVDANRPPWNDLLLPAGMLREPFTSIRRADLVVVTKLASIGSVPRFRSRIPRPACFTGLVPVRLAPFGGGAGPQAGLPVTGLAQRVCIAFSGLGNNEAFERQLLGMGLQVVKFLPFPDHYRYRPQDIDAIVRRYRRLARNEVFVEPPLIVTTEKDYSRLRNEDWFKPLAATEPFYYLEVSLRLIEGREAFERHFQPITGTHGGYNSAAVQRDALLHP